MWARYRFKTKHTGDYRPLIFNPKYPWWCTGSGEDYAIIVAYLPPTEKLEDYWEDADFVEYDPMDRIIFNERFPKPEYFEE